MKHQTKPLLLVACIFLFVGALVCMNDILLPSLKTLFRLSYTESTRVQQSFYIVHLFSPIPIAFLIAKWGYRISLIIALLICTVGCALFLPAYLMSSFFLALVALFIVALGIALVNVAANPLAAMLGDPEGAHARVNLVQVFSRIGFALTPVAATAMIYGSGQQIRFHLPYVWICLGTGLMALLVHFSGLTSLKPAVEEGFTFRKILAGARMRPRLFWGAIAMFFYIGADACTAGFFINYLTDRATVGYSAEKAGRFLTYYYVVTTIVGFAGIYLFRFFKAGRLVAIFATGMVLMLLVCAFTRSEFNPYAMVSLGAFISILFPTIFSLGIEGLGDFTEKGSALINIAIVGGAFFPPLQGLVADGFGVQVSYVVPALCFICIVAYGIYCSKGPGYVPPPAHEDPLPPANAEHTTVPT